MFQSSWMSWSSITIETETVESSQRMLRVLPRLAIQARVLLEVGDLLARRLADVAALADEGERLRRDLVGVDLVAEQQQGPRPAAGVGAQHLLDQRVERVELAAVGVLALRQRCRGRGGAARRGRSRRRVAAAPSPPRVRITLGGNSESGSGQRRSPSSATSYSVRRARLEPLDDHERVVVAADAEGRLGVAEHLDLARLVGLDPDHRLGLADVAQQWAEHELRHARPVPVPPCREPGLPELGQALVGGRGLGVQAARDAARPPRLVAGLDRACASPSPSAPGRRRARPSSPAARRRSRAPSPARRRTRCRSRRRRSPAPRRTRR